MGNVTVTNADVSGGVSLNTSMPLALGTVPPQTSTPFTLKYHVPGNPDDPLVNFSETVYFHAKDIQNKKYYYPAQRSFYTYNPADQLTANDYWNRQGGEIPWEP